MGREIRMVPANWQHPTEPCKHWNNSGHYSCGCKNGRGFKPLNDESWEEAVAEWKAGYAAHKPEEHEGREYWEWGQSTPDRELCRPNWTDAERTHFQIYETVSDGTPVSPVFASRDELAAWLIANGTSEEAAKKFAEEGFCFSLMFDGRNIKTDYETLT